MSTAEVTVIVEAVMLPEKNETTGDTAQAAQLPAEENMATAV